MNMKGIYIRAAISSPWLFAVGVLIHQTFQVPEMHVQEYLVLDLFLDGAIHRGVVGFPYRKCIHYSLGEYYRILL